MHTCTNASEQTQYYSPIDVKVVGAVGKDCGPGKDEGWVAIGGCGGWPCNDW